jgi:Spy/CpxP family protein refolding chaperone
MVLALGIGLLGYFALRRARRRCYAGGFEGYGWHGPWAAHDEDHHWRGGPPWRHGHRRRRGRRWMLHAALARLDATPAQERVIVAELDKLQERVHTARGGLHEVRNDLAAAVRGSALDDAALGAVLGRVDGATAEVRAAALDAVRNIHAVLDEKQRAELAEMLEARQGAGWWRSGPYR